MKLEEYIRELVLMKKQYGQEEELYPLINMLLRENDNVKNLSVRDVHNHASSGLTHDLLYGYASFPDLVIVDEEYDPESEEDVLDKAKKMYGCVEAKGLGTALLNIGDWEKMKNLEIQRRLDVAEIAYGTGKKVTDPIYYAICKNNYIDNKLKNNRFCTIEKIAKIREGKEKIKSIKDSLNYFNNIISLNNDIEWKKINNDESIDMKVIEKTKDEKPISFRIIETYIINNKIFRESQLIGELLWYGKMLYTNGIVWYYLEVDKRGIMDGWDKTSLENVEELKKLLIDQKNYLFTKNTSIQFTCTEIGNLSYVTKVIEDVQKDTIIKNKLEKISKKFYLRDEDTYQWEQEWARLKYNLACINWRGTNKPEQFILEPDDVANISETQ